MYLANVAVEQPKNAQASSKVQSKLPSARNAVGVIGAVFFRGGRIQGGANGRLPSSFRIASCVPLAFARDGKGASCVGRFRFQL